MKPTFLGIGAQRAGTTWLDRILRGHPQAFLPTRRKELHYFDAHYDRGPAWYASFFEDARPELHRAVGEITPRYLFEPAAAERIANDLPEARLIAILRDPVERAYSQYALTVRDEDYGGDFAAFLEERPDALARGRYHEQLERYLARFPRESLAVLVFEEVTRTPRRAFDVLARLLDLDPAGFDERAARRSANPGHRVRFARSYATLRRAGDWLREHDIDRPVNAFKRLGLKRLFGSRGALPPLAEAERRRLGQRFADDAARLARTFELDLSAWRSLPVKILLYVRHLGTGGAERQFAQMASDLAQLEHAVVLVTQLSGGHLAPGLQGRVEHRALFDPPRSKPAALAQLFATPRALRGVVQAVAPDVVYSALYLANACAHRALRRAGPPLVWGLRNAEQPLGRLRRVAFAYGRRHAHEVALAISNSHAAVAYHAAQGFHFRDTQVVPNGIDAEHFRPDEASGRAFRERLGFGPQHFLVGLIGRLVELKDPDTFLRAAAGLVARAPESRFVLVGPGTPTEVARLRSLADRLGLVGRVVFHGQEDDVRTAHRALDLCASTSLGEGFPNSIGEAMSCGVPCVVTDVGDSARVLGQAGRVVPPRSAEAQSEAWDELRRLGNEGRRELGRLARRRIEEHFSPRTCALRTAEALARVVPD